MPSGVLTTRFLALNRCWKGSTKLSLKNLATKVVCSSWFSLLKLAAVMYSFSISDNLAKVSVLYSSKSNFQVVKVLIHLLAKSNRDAVNFRGLIAGKPYKEFIFNLLC